MQRTTPNVFIVGQTNINEAGVSNFMQEMGYPEWKAVESIAVKEGTLVVPVTGAEAMIEFYGRLCYRSFAPGLNPNVSKVREGNADYIANIIKSKHGSVLEHATVNFVFTNVSRVFTHELVRHRVGVAISQESLRYVRLENLSAWLPAVITEDEHAMSIFVDTIEHLEEIQKQLAKHFDLDNKPFSVKKLVTSAMRRIAPIGLATTIGWTANHRTIRFLLELRTDPSAEDEIRIVFDRVGKLMQANFPSLYADFERVECEDGIGRWMSGTWKV